MSDESRSRRRKYCIWGLVLFTVISGYPLGLGPWVYLYDELPPPLQQPVQWMYFPILTAIQTESFDESSIGQLYLDYLFWWQDLRED